MTDNISLDYTPVIENSPVKDAHLVNVDVKVIDNRRGGKDVGRKKDTHGIELGSIRVEGDLSEKISEMVKSSLRAQGFNLSPGNFTLEIELQKFYNEFTHQFFGSRGVAEAVFGVQLKTRDGQIVYSKTIIGLGENDDVYIHSGKNAKIALQDALQDALNKLFHDQHLAQILLKMS